MRSTGPSSACRALGSTSAWSQRFEAVTNFIHRGSLRDVRSADVGRATRPVRGHDDHRMVVSGQAGETACHTVVFVSALGSRRILRRRTLGLASASPRERTHHPVQLSNARPQPRSISKRVSYATAGAGLKCLAEVAAAVQQYPRQDPLPRRTSDGHSPRISVR